MKAVRRFLLIAFSFALVAVIGVYLFRYFFNPELRTFQSAIGEVTSGKSVYSKKSVEKPPLKTNETTVVDKRSALLIISQQMDLGAAYRQLAAMKESAEAKFLAFQVMQNCVMFQPTLVEVSRKRLEQQATGVALERRRRSLELLAKRCQNIPSEPLNYSTTDDRSFYKLREDALELHDPRAAASMFGMYYKEDLEDKMAALAEKFVASQDPVMISSMAQFYEKRDRLLYRFAPFEEAVDPKLIAAAFVTASCRIGDDCGPTSVYLNARCVSYGNCDAVDGDSYANLYLVPTGQQQNFGRLVETVMNGIQSAQWPKGFWRGIRRS